jgi:hypothetical protein
MPIVAVAKPAGSTKAAMTEYFAFEDQVPKLERSTQGVSLEICFDTCDLYVAKKLKSESDLWDLAFLHQYYVATPFHLEKFRSKYASLAEPILQAHSSGCKAGATSEAARCIVERLAAHIAAKYYLVGYDEGYRCQTPGSVTDPNVLGKSVCKRLQVQ